jgi:hypothetical protein
VSNHILTRSEIWRGENRSLKRIRFCHHTRSNLLEKYVKGRFTSFQIPKLIHLDLLQDSEFIEDLEHITDCFDKTTKLRFKNSAEDQYTKFGGPRDNDPKCNIRFGQLKLLGSDVATFFEPSIKAIVDAVLSQRRLSPKPIFVERFMPSYLCSLYSILTLARPPRWRFRHQRLVIQQGPREFDRLRT